FGTHCAALAYEVDEVQTIVEGVAIALQGEGRANAGDFFLMFFNHHTSLVFSLSQSPQAIAAQTDTNFFHRTALGVSADRCFPAIANDAIDIISGFDEFTINEVGENIYTIDTSPYVYTI